MKILVGIVTFNPDIERLKENLFSVYREGKPIIIVDNGSSNINQIDSLVSRYIDHSIRNKTNMGIAFALKQIMDYAICNEYEWVFTLDQDSVVVAGIIKKYIDFIQSTNIDKIGAISCLIEDRNLQESSRIKIVGTHTEVDFCITSACLMNVQAYIKTSGYDISMFIDKVDFDICYSLRESGYKILKIHWTGLLHELGHCEERSLFGIRCVVSNHSALRLYYIYRNAIYMTYKHKKIINISRLLLSETKRLILIFLYEKDIFKKFKSIVLGIEDGMKMVILNMRGTR